MISLLFAFYADAQQWYVKGGYSFSYLKVKEQTFVINKDWSFLSDYHLTTGLLIPINKHMAISAECAFNNIGGLYTEKDEEYSYHLKYRFSYLQLPVNIRYLKSFKKGSAIYGDIGFYAGAALTGKEKERIRYGEAVEYTASPMAIGNTLMDDFRRIDAGINTGFGWKNKRFFMEYYFRQGLMNISPVPKNDITIRQMSMGISMGFILLDAEKKWRNKKE